MDTMLFQEQTLQESVLHQFKKIVHTMWISFLLCFWLISLRLKLSRLSLKWQQCMQFKFMKHCSGEHFTLFICYFQLPTITVGSLIFQ